MLEAFKEMPDHHLTVCGPIASEPEFVAAFHEELFETPNIETHGWVDIASQEFIDLAQRILAVVFPSCSEGGGGGVITCMHAGLIPIVTREASVDIEAYGIPIERGSVDAVRTAVREASQMPAAELAERSHLGWSHAREHHTRERFARAYRAAAQNIPVGRFRDASAVPQPLTTDTAQGYEALSVPIP